MPVHGVCHPLSRGRFYAECLRYATTGAWGVIGDGTTALPLAALLFKVFTSKYYTVAAVWLKTHGLGEELFLEVPLTLGGLILLARLFTAPFVLYRDKTLQPPETSLQEQGLSLGERLRILSAQIASFYDGRLDSNPGPLHLQFPPQTPKEWNDASLESTRHGRETTAIYLQQFAQSYVGP